MDAGTLDEALRGGDVDELIRLVDACCATRDWDSLARLRARCDRAHETGHQLWPAASHAAYRLALEAPAHHAGAVLVEGAGRFAPGPLPEVAAQHHSWAELAPHVAPGAPAMLAAHERVMRGEDLAHVVFDGPPVLDVPMRLAEWEPAYELAEYHEHDAHFPTPASPPMAAVELPHAAAPERLDDAAAALRDVTRVWTDGSNGRVEVAAATGDALGAIAALGHPEAARATVGLAHVGPAEALAHLGWAGASGGAYGRRPGAAAGRFAALWAAAALTELLDVWPPEPDRLGDAVAQLDWVLWTADEPTTGWRIQLAVGDPRRGRSWALRAHDVR
jgi:hypothetical protein